MRRKKKVGQYQHKICKQKSGRVKDPPLKRLQTLQEAFVDGRWGEGEIKCVNDVIFS